MKRSVLIGFLSGQKFAGLAVLTAKMDFLRIRPHTNYAREIGKLSFISTVDATSTVHFISTVRGDLSRKQSFNLNSKTLFKW